MKTRPSTQATVASQVAFSRRRFLLQALGLGAAGLTVGGGAAWAQERFEDAQAVAATADALQGQVGDLTGRNASLATQLADLKSLLVALNEQNVQLTSALASAQAESDGLKTQLASTQDALAAARARVGQYQELTGMFDLLEGVGLDATARAGLEAAAGGLAGALGVAPLLGDGLQLARDLLAAFEQAIPGLQEAMAWLGEQVVSLRVSLYLLEANARQAAQSAAIGAAAVFGGFAARLLGHLPFQIGENVRSTLAAIQELISRASQTAEGADDQVLLKVSRHVADGPESWPSALIAPLREQTLAPAEQLLAAVSAAGGVFDADLKSPVGAALDARAALREQIAAYRAEHQI